MPDLQKITQTKDKIISVIRFKGPSFPARISKETGISPLFVSAFLSELLAERRIKISNMKVGSSPLYFIEGQEHELEKFVEFLNHKEREAFTKLKENQILDDDEQEPAIRVALRKINDFAFPLNVKIGEQTKTIWKFFKLSEADAKMKIQEFLFPKKEELTERIEMETPVEKIIENKIEEKIKEESLEKITEEKVKPESNIEKPKESVIEKAELKKKAKKEKPKEIFEFEKTVKDYLSANKIELIEEVESKKKEFYSKVSINTVFGKQEFFLTAKDKKKIGQDDLTIAIQKAQIEKMPALLLSTGELDKKAIEHMTDWKNMIKFSRIN